MLDVIVVGAGPVGLFLACRLARGGLNVEVLEKRAHRSEHSRAIGIHPPSLRLCEVIGIADDLVSSGVPVREGVLFSRGRQRARLSFSEVSSKYPFVLSVPQQVTERVLRSALAQDGRCVVREGVVVSHAVDYGTHVAVTFMGPEGDHHTEEARFVVGADGPHSVVRKSLGIETTGQNYADTYLMGDFEDATGYGPTAVLCCEPSGIVESFPLPGGFRRWVAHTGSTLLKDNPHELHRIIAARTGQQVDVATNTMISAFAVRYRLARRFVRGNIALVGDAAHEIPPIGGQGMNLGWMDADALSKILTRDGSPQERERALGIYEKRRKASTKKAARVAEWNMRAGRPAGRSFTYFKVAAFAYASESPVRHGLARTFTMSGL